MHRRTSPGGVPRDLQSVRLRIDEIDEGLIELIAARVELARKAAEVKRAIGLGPVDLAREASVVRRASSLARERGVEPELMRDVYWRLIGLSRWAAGEPR